MPKLNKKEYKERLVGELDKKIAEKQRRIDERTNTYDGIVAQLKKDIEGFELQKEALSKFKL